MGLEGRVAVVSGAARGIGRAIAMALASDGANVAIFDVIDAAEATAAIRSLGRRATWAKVDIGDADQVQAGIAAIVGELGPVDILVNNASIQKIAPLEKITPAAWEQEITVNLSGAFHMVRAVIGGMAERQWGRIVNISSIAASGGLYNQSAYSASKAGLIGLTHNITLEYARKGITCNAILPGTIGSEAVINMPERILNHLAAMTPAKRIGTPDEVGRLVAFLCSDEAGFINGAEINIDGGARLNTAIATTGIKELSAAPAVS